MHLYMRLVFGAQRAHTGEGFHLKERVCTGCMDNRGALRGKGESDLRTHRWELHALHVKDTQFKLGEGNNEGKPYVRGHK